MYTIGHVSKMFNISISALRYYDKEGLFPNITRDPSGIRKFDSSDIDSLRVIEYLKKAGMQLKDIKVFLDWCNQGNATLVKRRDMFLDKKKSVEADILAMMKVLDLITYKCWYYTEAVKDNSEERVKSIEPEDMPEDIKKSFENSHGDMICG
nr:MerR family transcriptional regulator [Sediminispirochaeta smaragdinae]